MSSEERVARRFGIHAATYVVANVLTRGLWLLLTPFYTRVMTPSDYAVVSVANTLTSVIGITASLALYGAIPRLYVERGLEARKVFLTSIAACTIAFSLGVAVSLELLGRCGYLDVFPELPFRPHFELVIWTAVVSSWLSLPTQVYLAREEPRRVALLNFLAALTQLACAVLFVGVLRQNALGLLRGNLVAAVVAGALAIGLLSRMTGRTLSLMDVRAALAFSLPLVPHLLGNWALAVSDRLVLARLVSSADLGCYSLAYLLSTGVGMVASALATPISPAANRHLGNPETAGKLPPLGTYVLLVSAALAVIVGDSAEEIIQLLAPPSYGPAAAVVPWVVAGAVLQTLYLVWSTGTWYSKKTRLVPVITFAGMALNVGINVWLVPKFGIIVAAISTVIGYGVTALLHGALAQVNHPIPWEYSRWLKISFVAAVVYVLVHPMHLRIALMAIALKSVVSIVSFVLGLTVLRFWSAGELNVWTRWRGRGIAKGIGREQ